MINYLKPLIPQLLRKFHVISFICAQVTTTNNGQRTVTTTTTTTIRNFLKRFRSIPTGQKVQRHFSACLSVARPFAMKNAMRGRFEQKLFAQDQDYCSWWAIYSKKTKRTIIATLLLLQLLLVIKKGKRGFTWRKRLGYVALKQYLELWQYLRHCRFIM